MSQLQTPFADSQDNDFTVIVDTLRHHKAVILTCVLVGICLAFLYLSRTPDQYVASTQVQVKAPQSVALQGVMPQLTADIPVDVTDLRSRVEILQSPAMIRNLIDVEQLYLLPEIGGAMDIQGFDDVSERRQDVIMAQVKKRLSVKPVIGTSLIQITYRSADPMVAARVANGLVRMAINDQTMSDRTQAEQTVEWISRKIDNLKSSLREGERNYLAEQDRLGLVDDEDGSHATQDIERLHNDLNEEQSHLIEIESKIEQLDQADHQKALIVSDIIRDSVVSEHKKALAELEQERASLSQKYGANHPSMVANQKQIEAIQKKIDEESALLVTSLKNEALVARQKIDKLNDAIDQSSQTYRAEAERRIQLQDVEAQLSMDRDLLNYYLGVYQQAMQAVEIQYPTLAIISAATPPSIPSFPQGRLIYMLCSITGLCVGLFLALLLEKLHDVFRSANQVERITGLPVYGALAYAKKLKSKNPADFIHEFAATEAVELMRSLYVALKLRDPRRVSGGRVISITSTYAGEGKTTTAISLATTAVRNGDRVLIIDGDLRAPSLHKKYDIGNKSGLADYLSDRLPLEDVIYTRHTSGVHLMTAKAVPTHALTLLTGERIEAMIRRLRDQYDLIIIDAPASDVFSDSQVLAKLSDKTFYIIEWKKTRCGQVLKGIKHILDVGYKDLAIILNKVDIKQR